MIDPRKPKVAKPADGRTRPPDSPLDKVVSDAYNEVQPRRYKGDPRSAIEASAVDPDVEDSIGGE